MNWLDHRGTESSRRLSTLVVVPRVLPEDSRTVRRCALYRLEASEQCTLEQPIDAAHQQAEVHLAALRRIGEGGCGLFPSLRGKGRGVPGLDQPSAAGADGKQAVDGSHEAADRVAGGVIGPDGRERAKHCRTKSEALRWEREQLAARTGASTSTRPPRRRWLSTPANGQLPVRTRRSRLSGRTTLSSCTLPASRSVPDASTPCGPPRYRRGSLTAPRCSLLRPCGFCSGISLPSTQRPSWTAWWPSLQCSESAP